MEPNKPKTDIPFNPFGASNGLLNNETKEKDTVKTTNQESSSSFKGFIDLEIQKRTKYKTTTLIKGLDKTNIDLEKVVSKWRKSYCCSVANDNGVIKLSGDRRDDVAQYLIKENIVQSEQIRMHGY
jgi:translation initiation factor SUI1